MGVYAWSYGNQLEQIAYFGLLDSIINTVGILRSDVHTITRARILYGRWI